MTIPQFVVAPIYRFIHKGDNKVNQQSLFCLMCMIEGWPANLASVFAWSMTRPWRGGPGARMYCGPYVTWLAESLGVFTTYLRERMREGPVPCLMSLKDLQSAGIITYDQPPTWSEMRQGP
ncbi:hypothetical protein HanRHA438_Chr08g0342621 [Helianthus annuus]|nr:hypothetical protein HanHA89_Chr08g0290871 [Helianthus annuus]KAJ0897161.1 hypothetical protein HanRHA438_Chr08g0342621 [Helianthus annuus]